MGGGGWMNILLNYVKERYILLSQTSVIYDECVKSWYLYKSGHRHRGLGITSLWSWCVLWDYAQTSFHISPKHGCTDIFLSEKFAWK